MPQSCYVTRTVRGDATLLAATDRDGWHGYEADWLLPSAGIVLDAMLAGVLDVSGRRVLGFDRRRVAPGPAAEFDGLLEPVARLARRLPLVAPEAPYEWVRHTATFAPELVLDELAARGAATRYERRWTLIGLTPGLVERDPGQYAAAQRRVRRRATVLPMRPRRASRPPSCCTSLRRCTRWSQRRSRAA